MNDLTLIQYWHQGTLPDDLQACQDTWTTACAQGSRHLFDRQSAAAFIAEHFGPREQKAFAACALPAMASDYFRYCALYVLGGLYVDITWENHHPLDEFLTGLDPEKDGFLMNFNDVPGNVASHPVLSLMGSMNFDLVLNGVIYVKHPQNAFIKAVLDLCTSLIERKATNDVGLVTGIGTLISLINLHKLPQAGLDPVLGTLQKQFPDYAEVFATYRAELADHYDSWSAAGKNIQQIPMDEIAPYIVRNKSASAPERHEWRDHTGSIFQ
ncbi:hypothetical protein J7382_02990 [Shimia sp. R11_0]|uniref:glycosyltransferase family 32 protein n=1 Tax=Shimia sp. R11_0 TaxID=2821096 RepID=UPI001ADB5E18|nr:glycosyltransferase [Shimia sp. R11_0]MBO9476492.1 hypothetical protein [Shimia sp. R11_0]